MLLAISGTPGTGKTAVSRLLAKRLGWRLVSLNDLAAKNRLYCGYDRRRKAKVVDTDRVAEEALRLYQQVQKARPGQQPKQWHGMIVESHYAHDVPADLTVILRCNPGELRKRLQRKGWPAGKIEENAEAEVMEVCKEEAREHGRRVVEMDTTGRRPEDVAAGIKAIIERLVVQKVRACPDVLGGFQGAACRKGRACINGCSG